MRDSIVIFPKPGVTFYLPGGVQGFRDSDVGVAVRADHAAALLAGGGVETTEQRHERLKLIPPKIPGPLPGLAKPQAPEADDATPKAGASE